MKHGKFSAVFHCWKERSWLKVITVHAVCHPDLKSSYGAQQQRLSVANCVLNKYLEVVVQNPGRRLGTRAIH